VSVNRETSPQLLWKYAVRKNDEMKKDQGVEEMKKATQATRGGFFFKGE